MTRRKIDCNVFHASDGICCRDDQPCLCDIQMPVMTVRTSRRPLLGLLCIFLVMLAIETAATAWIMGWWSATVVDAIDLALETKL